MKMTFLNSFLPLDDDETLSASLAEFTDPQEEEKA
jgi:hypothetical protein